MDKEEQVHMAAKTEKFEKPDKVDKMKALDAAIAHIEKQYGKGSVMKLGENRANMDVETVPTGSLSLDLALGLGGVPKGRIIEIYGPESSGKTTVTLHMVAEVQKLGGCLLYTSAMHQAGFTNAVASLGTAFTLQHGILLKRYTEEVLLAYDSDEAVPREATAFVKPA